MFLVIRNKKGLGLMLGIQRKTKKPLAFIEDAGNYPLKHFTGIISAQV